MKYIFGNIYCWFQQIYGEKLSYFLWGYDPATQQYSNPNLYNTIGIVSMLIALVWVIVFYYVINHPRYCNWITWLVALALNALSGFFWGFGKTVSCLNNGNIPEDLWHTINPDTGVETLYITNSTCWSFGLTNIFVITIFFILFTLILKWWSTNAKHVPF
jgi:hypothetical protein